MHSLAISHHSFTHVFPCDSRKSKAPACPSVRTTLPYYCSAGFLFMGSACEFQDDATELTVPSDKR